MRFLAILAAAFLIFQTPLHAETPLTLKAADGVTVFGTEYAATGKAKATILLFHQAGSNAAEYAEIAPRLVKDGFDAIAIDQRSGGTMFGRANKTVKKLGYSADYLTALPDLAAALAYAGKKKPGQPIIIWGSSYSASLVFLLAAKHPADIAAVLAFSPGEYFDGQASIAAAAAKVNVPVFVTSASSGGEVEEARAILAAVPAVFKEQFVPKKGVHGSSTLLKARNPDGRDKIWSAVEAFLTKALAASKG